MFKVESICHETFGDNTCLSVRFRWKHNKKIDLITVNAWTYETRYSWGHKCNVETIIDNEYDYDYSKIVYYNRTWETYRFQSVIHKSLRKLNVSDSIIKRIDNELKGRL